jgi:hypothetical protein
MKKKIELVVLILSLFNVLQVMAVTLTEVKCSQRWPWNDKVDIDYTLSKSGNSNTSPYFFVTFSYRIDGENEFKISSLEGDGVNGIVKGYGKHRTTWLSKKDTAAISGGKMEIAVSVGELSSPPDFEVKMDQTVFSRFDNVANLTLINKSVGYFNYVVEKGDDANWLKITPPSGKCKDYSEIELEFDRSKMTNGYYRSFITINGGEFGTKTILISVPNGTVLYAENFEAPFMLVGEISGQGTWSGKRDDGYENKGNAMLVTNVNFGVNGRCAYIKRAVGWNGYGCDVDNIGFTWASVLKGSMKIYKSSRAKGGTNFSFQNDYWNRSIRFDMVCEDNYFYLRRFGQGNSEHVNLIGDRRFPLDTWLDFSFTLDYNRRVMTSLTIGNFTTNFANGIPLPNKPNDYVQPNTNFTRFCISCGSEETEDAMLLLDDLRFEEIP